MHFRARVGLFRDEIIRRHPGQAVLVVAHGGTVDALADTVFNVRAYRRYDIRVANTSFSHFEY
jgi:broad specificity phosphatase PhoE